jgi:hypothetical protein
MLFLKLLKLEFYVTSTQLALNLIYNPDSVGVDTDHIFC